MKKFMPILLSIVLIVSLCTVIGVSAETLTDSEVEISAAAPCDFCIYNAYIGPCKTGCGGFVNHIGHDGDCPRTRCVSRCDLCTQKYYAGFIFHRH